MNFRNIITALAVAAAAACVSSCSSGESYANLLEDENKDVNRFLADHRVATEIPADNKFETGEDAPYYEIDAEQGIYMQVLDPGDPSDMAQPDQQIYFRYMRASLKDYTSMDNLQWIGNAEDLAMGNFSFRYDNYSIPSSYQWGTGIQQPLRFLGMGCTVNLVVKSLSGIVQEQSQVIPFIYKITYNKSQLTN